MDPIVVFGMTASAIVVLIVQVAKAVGLPMAVAPWFTLAVALGVVALSLALQLFPGSRQYVEALVSVFGVFLLATGGYHLGKNAGVALGLTSGQK